MSKFDAIETSYIECTICLENKLNPVALPCGHIFHKECINRLAKTTCPNCRKQFSYTQVLHLHVSILNNDIVEEQCASSKLKFFAKPLENFTAFVSRKEFIPLESQICALQGSVADLEFSKVLMDEKLNTNSTLLSHLKRQIKGYTESTNQLKKLREEKSVLENRIVSWEKYAQVMDACPLKLKEFYKAGSSREIASVGELSSSLSDYKISNMALSDRILKINKLHEEQVASLKEKVIKLKSHILRCRSLKPKPSDVSTPTDNLRCEKLSAPLPAQTKYLDDISENDIINHTTPLSPNLNRSNKIKLFNKLYPPTLRNESPIYKSSSDSHLMPHKSESFGKIICDIDDRGTEADSEGSKIKFSAKPLFSRCETIGSRGVYDRGQSMTNFHNKYFRSTNQAKDSKKSNRLRNRNLPYSTFGLSLNHQN